MKLAIATVFLAIVGGDALSAENAWPQFRGPGGTGVSENSTPPVAFGPDKNVKWKVAVPSGFSSPIIAGDKLVITAFDEGKLYTIAYDSATGKEAWRAEAPAEKIEKYHKTEGSPAASTPATNGERIVSYFGSCGLFCYDLSGKELWKVEMPVAATAGDFGTGVSPIIADGIVILVRDVIDDPKIYAVDVATGTIKWEKPRQSRNSYATPVVWETPVGKQIAAAGHARMTGYDFATGDEKWFVTDIPSGCCPSPVAADSLLYYAGWSPGGADDQDFQFPTFDSLLEKLDKDQDEILSRDEAEQAFQGFFDSQDINDDGTITRDEHDALRKFMSEGKNCAFAMKADGSGDVTKTGILWKQTKGLPYVSSAIVYGGQYVMVKDGGIVTAYDAKSGDEVYQKRAIASGTYYASPVAANGHIYFTSLGGIITVLKAGAEKPVVVAENPKLDERVAATPAIVGNTLYVRTDKHLYAFSGEPVAGR